MNQVAVQTEGGAIATSQSASLLEQIVAAASNPDVDASKMKAMADLALQLQEHEQRQQFNRDLAAAIVEMPRISKRNTIVIPAKDGRPAREQGKFASWENIDAVIRPILERHNLALRFKLRGDQNGTYCTPILLHSNGWVDQGEELRVPPDTSGSKNAAQAIGSSAQYAKRYAASAALNIVTEGDDRDGTTYPLADDAMNDRQIRLVAEARASHADGNYAVWWNKQLAKDREWLILKGVHAELTGAPKIVGPRTIDDDGPEPPQFDDGPEPEPEPDPPANTKGSGRTAAQMVDDYVAKIDACESTDDLLKITENTATLKWLRGLHEKEQDEYNRASMASSSRYAVLMAREDAAKRQGDLLDDD